MNGEISDPTRVVSFVSKQLWRVNQGLSRISPLWSMISFLTFIKVWQSSFEYWGISIGVVFTLLGVAYLVSSWLVGWVNEIKAFSRAEWRHQIMVQNPEYWELVRDASICRRILQKQEKEHDDGG